MSRLVTHLRLDAGLLQQVPGFSVPEGFTPDAWNVDIARDGKIWLPRLGAERWSSAALQAGKRVDGLWQLWRSDGTWVLIASCNGQLYTLKASGAATTLGSVLTHTRKPWSAQTYGDKLYILNGVDEPRVFDTELKALREIEDMRPPGTWRGGNWPAKVTLLNAGYNERLAMWGQPEHPSWVHVCGAGDPTDWDWTRAGSSAARLVVRENDGEAVVAVLEFMGLLLVMKQTVTVAYKNYNYLTSTADDTRIYPWGCACQESIIRHERGAMWWAKWKGGHGPMTLRAVQDYADIAAEVMVSRIQVALKDVSDTQLGRVVGFWDGEYERGRWFVPSQRSTKPDLIFDHYPLRRYQDSSKLTLGAFQVGGGLEATCVIALRGGGAPLVLAGSADGYINRLNFGRQDLGAAIESHYSFPTTMQAAAFRVTGMDILAGEGGGALASEVAWDDGELEQVADSLEPNVGDGKTARHWPMGSGRRFRPLVRHGGTDTPAELEGAILDLDVMGVR